MSELISKLGLDWKLLLANTTTFFIILWVLKKYAFGPIVAMLDKRQADIKDSLEAVKKANAAAAASDEARHLVLKNAKHEAASILTAAEQQAQAVRSDIVTKAKDETDAMVGHAKTQLEQERLAMLASARTELADLVVGATRKVIGGQLDEKLETKLAKQALKEIAKP